MLEVTKHGGLSAATDYRLIIHGIKAPAAHVDPIFSESYVFGLNICRYLLDCMTRLITCLVE